MWLADSHLGTTQELHKTNFVCCWRAGADESIAMWDIYRKDSIVIAIKSTIGQLKRVVDSYDLAVYIGEVQYIDWKKAYWDNNLIAMYVRKALAYRHESEVRALIWDPAGKASHGSRFVPWGETTS